MRLGVIADDFTGATDIAGFLVEHGISAIQVNGIPGGSIDAGAEAYVVSLKSRSCPAEEAVDLSLKALEWLRGMGCIRFYFKYCSTFDSTDKGNIGPVTDALLTALGQEMTVVCPALPVNGRTIYMGYLFVHDLLLNESGMKDHPVTPMTDAKLARIIESQGAGKAGEVHTPVIEEGAEAVRRKLVELKDQGVRYAVLDALNDKHLETLGEAVREMPLITGGSGLAAALARSTGRTPGDIREARKKGRPRRGKTVILSGSCSTATNLQVARYRLQAASRSIDISRCLDDPRYIDELFDWTMEHADDPYAPLLYATSPPEVLAANKEKYGSRNPGAAIEELFAKLAQRLLKAGIGNFIVAGGETSGKVVQNLDLEAFHIGPQIAPGVPWVKAAGSDVYLALKSGNFGDEDFFRTAQEYYDE
jgi:3-dehydrotetronate 4-kinase